MNSIRIAVDAMGGDNGHKVVVRGAIKAAKANPVKIILVGHEKKLSNALRKNKYEGDAIEIYNATEEISMHESPKTSVESKPDASIVVAARLVGEGKADTLISAGSTGSVVLSAAKYIPRISDVRRTAIATVYPTMNELKRDDILSLLLDVGANIQCNAEELAQFAIMGSAYVSDVRGTPNPKVALLNIGEEASKGGEKMQEAYRILKNVPTINFVGNIEGKDILRGIVDVIVTEGFVGNIVIKTLEGAANTVGRLGKLAFKTRISWKLGLIMLRKGMAFIKEATDYSEYGGAPLLGFEKMVIIAHGRSNAKAISNAIKLAGKCVRDDVCGEISKNINTFEREPKREYERLTSERYTSED
ncbi:MAG: phosphate acyltransferase PlsX [Planctomycetia bacterium]|nr:phosphate acyltransferase PlsX [Planctomycetia bacterium]